MFYLLNKKIVMKVTVYDVIAFASLILASRFFLDKFSFKSCYFFSWMLKYHYNKRKELEFVGEKWTDEAIIQNYAGPSHINCPKLPTSEQCTSVGFQTR